MSEQIEKGQHGYYQGFPVVVIGHGDDQYELLRAGGEVFFGWRDWFHPSPFIEVDDTPVACPHCRSQGRYSVWTNNGGWAHTEVRDCETCGGSGSVDAARVARWERRKAELAKG